MRQLVCTTVFAAASVLAPAAAAGTSFTLAPAGGLGALAVAVDPDKREVRYASCKTEPCVASPASPSLAIPSLEGPVDPAGVTVEDVALVGGRHLAHVTVALTRDSGLEAPRWQALLVSGAPPLFTGITGYSRGEPGERTGTDVRRLSADGASVVVIGDLREDLRVCGDEATLLDPRGLDPSSLVFRGATLQRLSAARRDAATPVEATPRRAAADRPLTRLLEATEASSALAIAPAAALTDGDADTVWSEGRPGRGQGEFVLMRTPFDVPIVRFTVAVAPRASAASAATAAAGTSRASKPERSAPETFYLATGAGTFEVTLPEDAGSHPGEAYDIALPEPLSTSCVALVLADAFTRGQAHPDVSVAELTAYSAFDHAGATLDDVASALNGGGDRASAAAALLEQAGDPGVLAMTKAYASLDANGRALALNVSASSPSCAASAPLLIAALSDADEVVRGKAVAKLHEPACSRAALPALVVALASATSRAKVAPFVAFVGRERSLEALGEALGEGTPEDRHAVRAAVEYASRQAPPPALVLVLQRARTRSTLASLDALRALENRVSEVAGAADESVDALLSSAASLEVRYLLVEVVAPLAAAGDKPAQARLEGLILRDAAAEVRARAAEHVADTAEPDAVTVHALEDAEPRVREATSRAAGQRRLAAAVSPLGRHLANDPWSFVRVASAEALGRLPDSADSDQALGDALRQRSPLVREQAVRALGAHRAAGYRDVILERLRDAKEELAVRLAATAATGELCDPKAVADLSGWVVRGASSADPAEVSLGLAATDALGVLHPKDLAARFAPLRAKGARPDARERAARALETVARCPALP